MGRPREFAEATVLDVAMDLFGQQGYKATSVTDLCAATGLHKASLYQAFGNKHQLFLRSLQHYTKQSFKGPEVQIFSPRPINIVETKRRSRHLFWVSSYRSARSPGPARRGVR